MSRALHGFLLFGVIGITVHLPELKCLCHVVSDSSEEERPCCSRVLSEVELVILERRQS